MNTTVRLTTSTSGMQNIPNPETAAPGQPAEKNLLAQAVEFARNGALSVEDIARLKETAGSDGEMQASEALLLQSLEQDPEAFVKDVEKATRAVDFDIDRFSVKVSTKLVIKRENGKSLTLTFAPNLVTGEAAQPRSHILDGGSGKQARDALRNEGLCTPDGQLDDATVKAWTGLDKYHLSAVRGFMQAHILPDKQAGFASAYLEGYYAHTGNEATYTGRDMQVLLPALPTDSEQRKFVDCQGYAALTAALFDNAISYCVSAPGAEGGNAREHAVSVLWIGDYAYVQSNFTIQEIPAGASKSPEELIEAFVSHNTHDHPFSRPQKDVMGPLQMGVESFTAGDKIMLAYQGVDEEYIVASRHDNTTLIASGPEGKQYWIDLDPDSGDMHSREK